MFEKESEGLPEGQATDEAPGMLKAVWKDSLLTIAASGITVVLTVVFTGMLSRLLAASDFENYLFIRRFTAALFPVMTLAAGGGLTWILARSMNTPGGGAAELRGTWLMLFTFNAAVVAAGTLVPAETVRNFAFPIRGSARDFWLISLLWLFGYTGYVLLYSFHRGRLNMGRANAVNLILNGVAPLAALVLLHLMGRLTVERFLTVWAAAYFTGFVALLKHMGNPFRDLKTSLASAWNSVIGYSLPRIPAGFLAGFTAYVVPFFLVKNGVDAVYFLSAFLVLQTVNYLTDPLGQVFLPRSANWHQERSADDLAALTGSVFSLFFQAGIVMTVQIYIMGDLITFLWFGPGYAEAGAALRCLCFAMIPVLFHTPLRSILDGIEKKPLITHFLSISCTVTILMCFLFQVTGRLDTVNACRTVLASNVVLFMLLAFALHGRINFSVSLQEISEGAAAAAILGLASWLIVKIPWHGSFLKGLAILILASCICKAGFLLIAWSRKPLWWRSMAGMKK